MFMLNFDSIKFVFKICLLASLNAFQIFKLFSVVRGLFLCLIKARLHRHFIVFLLLLCNTHGFDFGFALVQVLIVLKHQLALLPHLRVNLHSHILQFCLYSLLLLVEHIFIG